MFDVQVPLSNELDVVGDQIRDVLPPQERLLAVSSVSIAFGWTGQHDPDFVRNNTSV